LKQSGQKGFSNTSLGVNAILDEIGEVMMGGAHCRERAAFTVSLQMNEPLCFTVRGHVRLHSSAPVIFKVMDCLDIVSSVCLCTSIFYLKLWDSTSTGEQLALFIAPYEAFEH